MRKKTCANCYWVDKCQDKGKRCEDYDPVIGRENVILHEYIVSLKERCEEYQAVVDEQNS